ncbi:hypothetical protein [Neobacillus cucumis]|uniref:hypothetical protein n=1 Tax=Neobacillus cucumis TaxID=1740721 RepID=UPI0035A95E2A
MKGNLVGIGLTARALDSISKIEFKEKELTKEQLHYVNALFDIFGYNEMDML